MVAIITGMWPSISYRRVKKLCWYLEKIWYCWESSKWGVVSWYLGCWWRGKQPEENKTSSVPRECPVHAAKPSSSMHNCRLGILSYSDYISLFSDFCKKEALICFLVCAVFDWQKWALWISSSFGSRKWWVPVDSAGRVTGWGGRRRSSFSSHLVFNFDKPGAMCAWDICIVILAGSYRWRLYVFILACLPAGRCVNYGVLASEIINIMLLVHELWGQMWWDQGFSYSHISLFIVKNHWSPERSSDQGSGCVLKI